MESKHASWNIVEHVVNGKQTCVPHSGTCKWKTKAHSQKVWKFKPKSLQPPVMYITHYPTLQGKPLSAIVCGTHDCSHVLSHFHLDSRITALHAIFFGACECPIMRSAYPCISGPLPKLLEISERKVFKSWRWAQRFLNDNNAARKNSQNCDWFVKRSQGQAVRKFVSMTASLV